MREYISVDGISIENVLSILAQWEDATLSYQEVQAWAEGIIESRELVKYQDDDPQAAVAAVIEVLEGLYGLHLFKEDVPALRRFLGEHAVAPDAAWPFLRGYLHDIESEKRWNQPYR